MTLWSTEATNGNETTFIGHIRQDTGIITHWKIGTITKNQGSPTVREKRSCAGLPTIETWEEPYKIDHDIREYLGLDNHTIEASKFIIQKNIERRWRATGAISMNPEQEIKNHKDEESQQT